MRWLAGLAAILLSGAVALADGGRVWVAPFTDVNGTPQQADWISRALRQSVADDLASIRGVTVVNPTTRPAGEAEQKPGNVDYVVSGTIQRVEGELRVTGRVEEAASGKIVGGFKATGMERDLFAIEDLIAAQVKSTIAPSAPPAMPAVAGKAPTPASAAGTLARTGMYEGSDLQRALEDRDYLRRLQQQS